MIKSFSRVLILLIVCFFPDVIQSSEASSAIDEVPIVVTPDIQAGIEKYIEDKTKEGKGFFKFTSNGRHYLFKLVKVHTEYLATLEPGKYFACIDLVDTKGDVYDVDFFMAGTRDNMTVTSTTLHKINGIPYYAWEQAEDKSWKKVPMQGASPELLGVKKDKDKFDFHYAVTIPKISKAGRVWIPIPSDDKYQNIKLKKMESPVEHKILRDKEFGNKVAFFKLGPKDSGKKINIIYQVERKEKAAYPASNKNLEKYLKEDKLIPNNENFSKIANEAVKNKKGDLVRARALYDHVIDIMSYNKSGKGWGKGDAVYACDIKTGNCTDFHSYFIALARTINIPARFSIGAGIPSSRNEGGVDGYHCWAEFYAEGKWWPVDISEANKYSSLATYYFGHHPANRLELSQGRDLVLDPGPKTGPINFLAYPYVEIDNKRIKALVKFSFNRESS